MLGYKTFMEDAMRRLYPLLLCLCLMLTGCQRRDIQAEFEALSSRLAESGSLSFTVERSGKSLIGSAASGEGLVNVYRGTGKVLLAPVVDGIV